MKFFNWLFRRKPQAQPWNPLDTAPMPGCGNYEVLPMELDWFDWTDYDNAFLTVDGNGTVKLHSWYAWQIGIEWHSLGYQVIGQIDPPGAAWVGMYWLRPSWYADYIGDPALIQEAWDATA